MIRERGLKAGVNYYGIREAFGNVKSSAKKNGKKTAGNKEYP